MSTPNTKRRRSIYSVVQNGGTRWAFSQNEKFGAIIELPMPVRIRFFCSSARPPTRHATSGPIASAHQGVANAVKTSLLGALLALGGCATCSQHPVACSIATAIVAGSIAASVQHHHDQQHDHAMVRSQGCSYSAFRGGTVDPGCTT